MNATGAATPPPAQQSRPKVAGRLTSRERLVWGLLIVVIFGLVGLSVGRLVTPRPVPPPRLGVVPSFELIDRDGTALTNADLAGKPYISDFFFTRCVSICPRLTQQMKRIANALDEGRGGQYPVRLVSFSVDPENDTPAVLDAYARRFSPPPWWHFVTGERDAMYALIGQGFKLAVDDTPEAGVMLPGDDILHSDRLVLVDAGGHIRGYYGAFDEEAVARLLADVATVAGE